VAGRSGRAAVAGTPPQAPRLPGSPAPVWPGLPEQLEADEGLRLLLFFGDELQIPTTGVSVDPSVVTLDDPRVKGLVRANLRALGALLADPALGAEHVGRLLPAADDATARDFYDRYVGSRFKADGAARC